MSALAGALLAGRATFAVLEGSGSACAAAITGVPVVGPGVTTGTSVCDSVSVSVAAGVSARDVVAVGNGVSVGIEVLVGRGVIVGIAVDVAVGGGVSASCTK